MNRLAQLFTLFGLGATLSGCMGGGGGNGGGGVTPTLSIPSSTRATVDANGTVALNPSVNGLGPSPTFSWTLGAPSAQAATVAAIREARLSPLAAATLPACLPLGTLSPTNTANTTYTPPAASSIPSGGCTVTATVSATGKGQTLTASFTITVTGPISVSITNSISSIPAASAAITINANVTNDENSLGVTWSIGAGDCNVPANACGTLTNATATSVTYTPPPNPPTPSAQVIIIAASKASAMFDSSTNPASANDTFTVTPVTITLAFSPNPPFTSVNAGGPAQTITVDMQHDTGGQGVGFTFASSVCNGPSFPCGTLTSPGPQPGTPPNTVQVATYKPPATQTAASATIVATAVGGTQPSISFTFTINPASSVLNITTTSPLPGAMLNSAYSTTVTASGGTAPYTFTLASGSALPDGLSLTSGSPGATISGTPTATGTFQFTIDVKDSGSSPATASGSFLITVTGSSSFTCPSPVNPSLPLCGTNLFEVAGFPVSGGVTATIFVILIDNNANVISGEETSNDSVTGYTTHTITGGNYAMDSSGDGRGVLTVIDSTAASATYRFAVFSTANYKPGPVQRFDSSGVLAKGITSIIPSIPVPQIPANTVLGAQFTGVTGAGHKVGVLGSFEVGPAGCDGSSGSFNSQTGETLVVNNGGTVTTGLTATGSCTAVDANGIGSAQIILSGGTPFTNNTLHFTYVEYNNSSTPTFAIFLSSDSIGTNQPVLGGLVEANPQAGTLSSSVFAGYCGGTFACVATQSGTNGSAENIKALIRFVATSTSGTGGTLSGAYDQNAAGTITANASWPYTAYTVDANGVGTLTGSGQTAIHFIYNNGGLYTLDESSEVRTGTFDQQNSVTMEDPGSNYVAGDNDDANPNVDFLGVLVPTGTTTSGTLPGVVDVISTAGSFPGETASGSYTSLSATGRSTGTANFTNAASALNTVIYIARHRRFWILDVQSTTPFIADAALQ